MKAVRILLADDHALLRTGIRTLLEKIPGVTVVAEAENGQDAIEKMAMAKPDLVMMDISMPELNGIEALTRIAREFPKTRVVVLTMHCNEEYVLKAMQSGAAGYLLKNAKPAELSLALETIVNGESYISPMVAKTVTEYLRRERPTEKPTARLTPRQHEILILIAKSHSTKEIADRLKLSVKTVEMHRAELMERLQIHDIAGLVRYAIRNGLADSER